MKRHEMREQIFRMLFGVEFHTEDISEPLENYIEISLDEPASDEEKEEMRRMVLGISEKRAELDSMIDSVAEGWKTARMGRAELNILRLALYEMLYDSDRVPVKVAINEAVELAKEYGADDAHAFVNGILARLIDRLPRETEKEKD
ncbi:MAG: transcription antitermination factor NusB [Eubacteriales bacterium]|nr:transcription antitermination factor NusB [Eubacteriales bacterium]